MAEPMPESDVMPPGESSVKSPLDKPLHQLTEDDIAQLTREDCRRYLKEKGMRRPSWNKSQAIQQVIMLKKLLETTPDCEADSRSRLRISHPNINHNNDNTVPESVPKGRCGDAENAVLAEETAPYRRKDLEIPDSSGGFSAANNESALPRTTGSTNMSVGQMTIFYSGKVNVYDDVPADKARALMHIAASPQEFPQEWPVSGSMSLQPVSRLSKAISTRSRPDSAVLFPPMQTVKMNENSLVLGEEGNMLREETPVEGPSTRKASVQRYLEKRKDRFKSKRKAQMTSCASLDPCFNHQIDNQMLSRSHTCSPTLIRPPSTPTRCSSVDNDSVKNFCLPAALNNKAFFLSFVS
ncbi:hypothetical protein ACJIZ3_011780 [Penstemon smallii]|uniref:Protein TIFY n=1 Tax=Penstemon smallii TaxID=265156 RepID=A0ABD3UNC0_9LAMI